MRYSMVKHITCADILLNALKHLHYYANYNVITAKRTLLISIIKKKCFAWRQKVCILSAFTNLQGVVLR